jgi:hypothetical protein
MFTTQQALVPLQGATHFLSKSEKPVPNAKSDHKPGHIEEEDRPPVPTGAQQRASARKGTQRSIVGQPSTDGMAGIRRR